MKRCLSFLTGVAVLVALDQIVKLWVRKTLMLHGPIPLIPGVLEFYYVENRGAAFGIMQNRQWFFLIITIIILAVILWVYPRIPDRRRYLPLRLVALFITAGALGNMIDRMTRGYVVDFIYFKLINFPVFNLADIYVTCSAFALAFLLLFYYKEEEIEEIFRRSER